MRVDLHCHTKQTKTGDGRGREVDARTFVEAVCDADVSIVAITNHNHFNLDQYQEFSEAASGSFMIWPGVELDVTGEDGCGWHTLVLCSPERVVEFNGVVNNLINGRTANEFCCPFSDAWNQLKSLNTLFVSHCYQKTPAISESNIRSIMSMAGEEKWRLFFEPRSLVTLGIWSNHGRSMLIGSDVKNWNKYKECTFSNLRLPVDSFEQFCLLARRDIQVVETLLAHKESSVFRVKPHPSTALSLPLYNDMNIIFGQKGTGKTEIIKSLCAECERQGIKYSKYFGGKKYDEYDKLLSIDGEVRDVADFNRDNGIDDIALVLNWSEQQPTSLSEYIKWYSTKGNNEKKDRFRLSECQKLPERTEENYLAHKADKSVVDCFLEGYSTKNLENYLQPGDAEVLQELVMKLGDAITKAQHKEFFEIKSTSMANDALASIKAAIDRKSDTKSKPSSTGFAEFAKGRIALCKTAQRIISALAEGEIIKKAYLGTLEDKGELFTVVKRRYLTTGSKTEEFSIGINKLRKWKKAIEAIATGALLSDLPEKVAAFVELDEEYGIGGLEELIGITKYVVMGNSKEPYEPSDGEKGILVIERKLREEASFYLLDEPELGMSNLYIDAVVRPILQDRAAEGKTVVVSTHNANLAVRTLPYCSIYREHVHGSTYRTFLGNPFSNKLVDLDDCENTIDWAATSMATLEGGPEAFKDRRTIYEAGEPCVQ